MANNSDLSHYYDLKKVFNVNKFPEEHQLVLQMETGTLRNFPDVMSGHQHYLLMLPDNVFHYEKGRDNVNVHIELLQDKIKELEKQLELDKQNNQNPISYSKWEERNINILELDHMKNLAKDVLTERAEMVVHHRFEELLHDEIGFLIHGYQPESYLNGITTRAKQQRKNLVSLASRSECSVEEYSCLTPLEEKLQEVLGLTSKIGGEANAIFSCIRKKYPGLSTYSAESIKNGIRDHVQNLDKLKRSMLCDKFLQNMHYDQKQAYRLIVLGLLHYYANQSREMDLLICLPEFQAILNVEIKYQLDDKKDLIEQAVSLLGDSSKQLNAHDDYITRVHGQKVGNFLRFQQYYQEPPLTRALYVIICQL